MVPNLFYLKLKTNSLSQKWDYQSETTRPQVITARAHEQAKSTIVRQQRQDIIYVIFNWFVLTASILCNLYCPFLLFVKVVISCFCMSIGMFVFNYNKFYLHLCYIYISNTNTVIRNQIDLGFHSFYVEITWKIHGILCYQRSGNAMPYHHPLYCLRFV